MCGLVGLAGDLAHKDEATIKKLLVIDYFRGTDSTGLAALRKNGDVHLVKAAVNPIDLFDMGRFKTALAPSLSSVLLGHNRAATKGAVNNNNAHPFQYDHIVGAHNGTLEKSSWDKLDEMSGVKTDVDSMAIFAAIAKCGIEAVVPELQGAWALTWIDLKEGTLNFLRNKERPLWYAYSEDFKKVFWASEYKFIDVAVSTSAIEYKMHKDNEGYTYYSFKENWWYRFNIKDLASGAFSEKPKPRVKELVGKAPAPVKTYGYAPFRGHGSTQTSLGFNRTTTITSGAASNTSTNLPVVSKPVHHLINLVGSGNDPFCGAVTEAEFEDLSKGGCSWCGTEVYYDEVGIEINTVDEYVKCSGCTGKNKTSIILDSYTMSLFSKKDAA